MGVVMIITVNVSSRMSIGGSVVSRRGRRCPTYVWSRGWDVHKVGWPITEKGDYIYG